MTNEPADDILADNRMARGHVRIWRVKGDRMWSVTVPIGTTEEEVQEALRIALVAAGRLAAAHPGGRG